jgi:hypothetical protein
MFRENQRKGKCCVLVKRFILSAFAYLFAAMHVFAQAPYICTTNNGVITITGYNGPGGNVVIPSTINSLPVTGIASNVFESVTSLTSVTVPGSVGSIGEAAFAFCSGLTNATISQGVASFGQGVFYDCISLPGFTIPASVTNVGEYAFQGCNNLTNVVIANGVTSLGPYAFYGCGGLTSVTLPPSLTYIGNDAYADCANLTNVVIPASVTSIGYGLFAQSPNLASVLFLGNAPPAIVEANNEPVCYDDFLATVYYLSGATEWWTSFSGTPTAPVPATAQSQFTYTTNGGAITITSYTGGGGMVIIPSIINGLPVTSIGPSAFESNNAVTLVAFPTNLVTIGDDAFAFCAKLNSVTFFSNLTTIGNGAFQGCTSLLSVTLPNTVTTIGNDSFEGCANMLSINFPVSLVSIGKGAFASCSNLANLYFFGNPPSLGSGGFANDADITTIDYSPSATGWGSTLAGFPTTAESPASQFVYAVNPGGSSITITGYTGPGGIVAIPPSINGLTVNGITAQAFFYSGGLNSIWIPDSVAGLPDGAFYGCSGLTNVILGRGITSLGFEDFAGCSRLGSLTVPTNVTNIAGANIQGNYISGSPFQGCTGLTNLMILGSPIIGQYTFYELPLRSVYIAGGSIGPFAFAFCNNLSNMTLTLGNGVTNIGVNAFLSDGISSLLIPGSVTNIGESAFSGCPLTNLTISYGVVTIGDYAFNQNLLTSIAFPSSVTSIGDQTFAFDHYLTNAILPASITSIGGEAFAECALTSVLCLGNAPALGGGADGPGFMFIDNPTTVYYLPGTTGWPSNYGDAPTALWNPAIQTSGPNFGVVSNRFGFNITGTSNDPVQLQVCTNLASQVWTPLTNISLSNGLYHYSEPIQSNWANRFYRIVFP